MFVMTPYLCKSDFYAFNLQLDISTGQIPFFHLPQRLLQCDKGIEMIFYFTCIDNQKGSFIILKKNKNNEIRSSGLARSFAELYDFTG